MTKQTTMTEVSSRELMVTRVLNAPRELVWEAWTKPEHIAHWWGPSGFTNTIRKMDVRPGGEWEFTMHGPDGTDYPNKNLFKAVDFPNRIVLEHTGPPRFDMSVTFTAQGNKTLVEVRSIFDSAEELKEVVEKYGAAEGLKQNIDKLEVYMEKMQSA